MTQPSQEDQEPASPLGNGQSQEEQDAERAARESDVQRAARLEALQVQGASPEELARGIEEIPKAEAAAFLDTLTVDQAAKVAEALDPETAAKILGEMDTAHVANIVTAMNAPEASLVLQAIDPDDRVDILEHVTGPLHDELLREMAAPQAAETRQLEQYPPDTAGGIMTTQVTALFEYLTVENAITLLRRLHEELEQMFYVYVVDRRQHLVGVLSMRDLILARPNKRLREVMIPNVRSVPVTMDQEKVAEVMHKYGYLAVPVVDDHGRLLGLITVDDVVDVIQEEATEDVQRMFGAGAEERLNSPWQLSFRKRVWWLLVNLGTAFMAASVVGLFKDTIEKVVILAAYMPIVAGMGGNDSAQAMAVAVRGLAVGRVDRSTLYTVLYRELYVGVLTGLFIGSVTALIALLWQGNPFLGVVVGLALIINHTLACTSGAGIPFVMKKLGFDPAQSATIFATTITDVAGFFGLLGLAKLFMKWLI
jgi:magnesium transporter